SIVGNPGAIFIVSLLVRSGSGVTGAGRVDKGAGLPIGQTVDQDQPAYQEPLACCPTRPRSRCPAAPSTTSPTSSAPTGHNYVRGGAGSTPAAKRCWCWPTYETATPTSGWPPGSASACPPPGATSTRPSTCWQAPPPTHTPRPPEQPDSPTRSSTAPSSRSTASPPTGPTTPANTNATASTCRYWPTRAGTWCGHPQPYRDRSMT